MPTKGVKHFMAAEENLYFIALVPPEPLKSKVWALKEKMRDQWGSKASLNSPAHITLHMPFELKQHRERAVIEALQELAEGYNAFTVELSGFSAFPPRVLYIHVVPNDMLSRLHNDVQDSMKRGFKLLNPEYKKRAFHPHMTLASRDLKKEAFEEAWAQFKEKKFEASWKSSGISLLRHNGNQWQELALAPFADAAFEEEEEEEV